MCYFAYASHQLCNRTPTLVAEQEFGPLHLPMPQQWRSDSPDVSPAASDGLPEEDVESLSDSNLGHPGRAIRMIAETQQQITLQQKRSAPLQDRGRVLGAFKLQDFVGHPNTLVRVYREW